MINYFNRMHRRNGFYRRDEDKIYTDSLSIGDIGELVCGCIIKKISVKEVSHRRQKCPSHSSAIKFIHKCGNPECDLGNNYSLGDKLYMSNGPIYKIKHIIGERLQKRDSFLSIRMLYKMETGEDL